MDRWLEALGDAGDAALVIDGQQRILFCKQAAIEIIGRNGEEFAGSFCYASLGGRSHGTHILCGSGKRFG